MGVDHLQAPTKALPTHILSALIHPHAFAPSASFNALQSALEAWFGHAPR